MHLDTASASADAVFCGIDIDCETDAYKAFTACKKDSNTVQLTASFTFSHNQANEISLVTLLP